jgi:hypothetical protein
MHNFFSQYNGFIRLITKWYAIKKVTCVLTAYSITPGLIGFWFFINAPAASHNTVFIFTTLSILFWVISLMCTISALLSLLYGDFKSPYQATFNNAFDDTEHVKSQKLSDAVRNELEMNHSHFFDVLCEDFKNRATPASYYRIENNYDSLKHTKISFTILITRERHVIIAVAPDTMDHLTFDESVNACVDYIIKLAPFCKKYSLDYL